MDVYKLDKFEHIYAVDCFDKEFSKMTNERLSDEPPYPRFQKWLISRLSILDKMGKNAIKLEGFEDLVLAPGEIDQSAPSYISQSQPI